jgi:diaminohydroxyphosphoribosylaminopyrimidine deaminase/5-amino-6-(5-phosphoribosylamino)uracil reductase
MADTDTDLGFMSRALDLAARGEGTAEPNPLVGCVVTRNGQVVGEGWHERYGQAHAEINALRDAGLQAAGGTLYVTLEPCCHHGQTPPCTQAVRAAGIARAVIAQHDPFPQVNRQGIAELEASGITVEVGLLAAQARHLNAPYIKRLTTGEPWIHAKWAMSLDGKIATRTGQSQWISGAASRQRVHRLRGRMDAIVVGRQTAMTDDPLLTARPAGPRIATRVVLDSRAALPIDSQLVQTAQETPLLVAAGPAADPERVTRLTSAGCEVLQLTEPNPVQRLQQLWQILGQRDMTHVLVEGGSQVLGSLLDTRSIDELHLFLAPKLVGGNDALSAVAGTGAAHINRGMLVHDLSCEPLGEDYYLHGRTASGDSYSRIAEADSGAAEPDGQAADLH